MEAAQVLGAFLGGADGWSIRRAIDRAPAPGKAPVSLFHLPPQGDPKTTVRLKFIRRLQADLDLLAQLQARRRWTRAQLGDFAGQYVKIEAGRPAVTPSSLILLRGATLDALSKMPE